MKEFTLVGWYEVPRTDRWGWDHIPVDEKVQAESAKKAIRAYIKTLPKDSGYKIVALTHIKANW